MHSTDVKGSCKSHTDSDDDGGDDECAIYNDDGSTGADSDGESSIRRNGDSTVVIECATSDPTSTERATITSWQAKWPPLRDCRGGVRVERTKNLTAQRFITDVAPASIPFIIPGAAAMYVPAEIFCSIFKPTK